MVRGRKAADPPPPLYGVQGLSPPDREAVEEGWKDCGWKHCRAPSVRWLWREGATGAVLKFLEDTRVGFREPPGRARAGEDRGEAEIPESDGEGGWPGPP